MQCLWWMHLIFQILHCVQHLEDTMEWCVVENELSTSSIEIWEPLVPKFQWKRLIIHFH